MVLSFRGVRNLWTFCRLITRQTHNTGISRLARLKQCAGKSELEILCSLIEASVQRSWALFLLQVIPKRSLDNLKPAGFGAEPSETGAYKCTCIENNVLVRICVHSSSAAVQYSIRACCTKAAGISAPVIQVLNLHITRGGNPCDVSVSFGTEPISEGLNPWHAMRELVPTKMTTLSSTGHSRETHGPSPEQISFLCVRKYSHRYLGSGWESVVVRKDGSS